MAGINLEPYPRQTLVGSSASVLAVYVSETYDLMDYGTLVYTMETYASIPATAPQPATMFLEAGNDVQGPWEDLIPGGTGPTVGNTVSGAVTLTGRYLRVRIDVAIGEITSFVVRLVARTE